MEPEQIKDAANEIIEKAEFTVLSTIDPNGWPESRAMLNLKEGGLNPIFSTNTSSRKIGQIEVSGKGCAYLTANAEWKGLALLGNIMIVEDWEVKKALWKDDWNMYYPKGIEDPDYSVLQLKTKKIVLYYEMNKAILEL